MKLFRKILFWGHLIAGCVGGLIILLMSLTGVLLTYERQMIASAERGPFRVQAPAGASALPLDELIRRAGLKDSATVTVRSAPGEPVEVNQGKAGIVYLNPYTAEVLGTPNKSTRETFQKLRAWHRWIALEGDWRATGKAITGACTLAFVGIVLSGIYLWLPQVWSWRHIRPILWFRGGLSGKARDFNWHNAIGIWTAIPLFFVIISALPISYQWANNLIYSVTNSEMPKADNTPQPKGDPGLNGINQLFAHASQTSGWQSISFRVGTDASPVTFTVDRGDGGQPQLRSTVTYDRASAAVLKQEGFSDFNTGRQVRSFSRFLHTGESLGIVGQTVAGIASLGGVVLVWTGLALALHRFRAWRRRKAPQTMATSPAAMA